MRSHLTKPRRRLVAVGLAGATLLAAGCGSGGASSTARKPAAAPVPKSTSASSSSGALSGKWSGHYSGAFGGTFDLNWKQAGSKLAGTINLSPGGTMALHGTVNGSAIKFGTVGSEAITYTGSVSGSSMSGNYNTPTGGGSWSASKS